MIPPKKSPLQNRPPVEIDERADPVRFQRMKAAQDKAAHDRIADMLERNDSQQQGRSSSQPPAPAPARAPAQSRSASTPPPRAAVKVYLVKGIDVSVGDEVMVGYSTKTTFKNTFKFKIAAVQLRNNELGVFGLEDGGAKRI